MATSTRPGDVLAGRYRLIDLLSESGGGRFWRAHDKVLERYVALHVIGADDPRADGLITAAQSSARILDPRILRVLDAETADGLCFVVNEWGTGTSLDILVASRGPLPPRPAAWLVAEVAAAIGRAHESDVAHGRLNPENVLVDRLGAVRIIGLCVDAALHGLPPGRPALDRADLGGLLHCALTGHWAGRSASAVAPALQAHGMTMGPRQVRPGVPRALDTIWREIDREGDEQPNRWRLAGVGAGDLPEVESAAAISDRLREFLGPVAGLPEQLASAILPINEVRPVWLPPMHDPVPHDATPEEVPVPPAEPEPATEVIPEAGTEVIPEAGTPAGPEAPETPETPDATDVPQELPTEPGMPVFTDTGDVDWLRARSTPPPPPPPFEDPPERPLFAPETPEGFAARRARAQAAAPTPVEIAARTPGPGDYWPWDTDGGGDPTAERDAVGDDEDGVPGRSWLRLALGVGLVVILLVAVVVAFNLGRGRTPLGTEEQEGPTRGSSPAPSVSPLPLDDITVTDFDPLGSEGENPELVGAVVDGDPATSWRTLTYTDQFGPPPGLKTGVGLVLDLGENRTVTSVELSLRGTPTTAGIAVTRAAPSGAPEELAVTGTSRGEELVLTPEADTVAAGTTTGRYVLVWFTSLPQVSGGFRAEVSEVVVRGH